MKRIFRPHNNSWTDEWNKRHNRELQMLLQQPCCLAIRKKCISEGWNGKDTHEEYEINNEDRDRK